VQVSRRVPLADIPGMLDALEEGERTAAFRRQYFPSNAHRLGAAGRWLEFSQYPQSASRSSVLIHES
jgi:hypothetical protein